MEDLLIDTKIIIITPFGEYKIKIKDKDEKEALIQYLESNNCGFFIKVKSDANTLAFHFEKVNYTL